MQLLTVPIWKALRCSKMLKFIEMQLFVAEIMKLWDTKNNDGGSQEQRTAVILHEIKIQKCRNPLWDIAFLCQMWSNMWSKAKNGLVQPSKQGRTSPLCLSRKREISRGFARNRHRYWQNCHILAPNGASQAVKVAMPIKMWASKRALPLARVTRLELAASTTPR